MKLKKNGESDMDPTLKWQLRMYTKKKKKECIQKYNDAENEMCLERGTDNVL